MLRLLLLALVFFWIGRLLVRLFLPARRRRRDPRVRSRRPQKPSDSLKDLTQQEISDADFEEIPPEDEDRR